jgi:DNA-binding response OmpR family regulator
MIGRILIIEDDLDFAGQLKTLTESQGHQAEVALTGAEGIRKFRSWSPDLVLLDLKLPNGHGLRVAQELRNIPAGADVPIFLMSAVYKRRALLEQDMMLLGIETYLLKPFSFDDLIRRIGVLGEEERFGRASVRQKLEGRTQRSGRAYARAESSPSQLPQALTGKKVSLEAEDTMLLADIARRLPRAGDMRPDIWVRILTTVFHSHSNGLFVRKIGEKRRSIYFLNGYPVWAEGPNPREGILRFFRVEGVLDGASAEVIAADLADGGMSLRGLMMATGKVTEEQLDGLFEDWVAEEVRNTLRHRGEFEFVRTEDFAGKVPIFEVNPIPTLWEGLEDALGSIEIRQSLDELAGRKLGRTRNFKKMFGYIGASPTLQGVGEMLEHPKNLHQIRNRFRDAPTVNLSIWFLLHAGLIAVSDSPTSTARSEAPTSENEPEGSSDSVGQDRPPSVVSQEAEDAGGMEVAFDVRAGSGARQVARSLEASLNKEFSSAAELVERHHSYRLELDYYSFLEVEQTASLEEIDAAYQVLAPRYRVRNLGADATEQTKEQARALLARLVNAFAELSDSSRRRAYDRLMESELQGSARGVAALREAAMERASGSVANAGMVPGGGATVDLSDWLPGGDDPEELRRRCVRLDEVDSEKLREARRAMMGGAFETAFSLLDSLRESNPSDVLLLADMGWCQFSMAPDEIRSVDKALEWVELGLAFEPANIRALAVRARILCYAQREEEAYASLQRLAPLMPSAEWVRLELARRSDHLEGTSKGRGLRRFWGASKS